MHTPHSLTGGIRALVFIASGMRSVHFTGHFLCTRRHLCNDYSLGLTRRTVHVARGTLT